MEDIAEKIVADGGWLALLIMVLTYIILRAVTKNDPDGQVAITQAQIIAGLVSQMEAISKNLSEVSKNLLGVADVLKKHDEQATQIRIALSAGIEQMRETVEARSQELQDLPEKVRQAVTPDIQAIPGQVEAVLKPQIEDLQREISALIAALDAKFTGQIAEARGEIPARTTELVREELTALSDVIAVKLLEMLETAKTIQAPEPPAQSEEGK